MCQEGDTLNTVRIYLFFIICLLLRKMVFFLDIGGNDPVALNNTLYFEENGWHGLAFEPVPRLTKKWGVRKTECMNIALGDKRCDVEFSECAADMLSGIGIESNSSDIKKYTVHQERLSDVLTTRGIDNVDFVSLDVEGYEMNVLDGIDFDKVQIKCICVENCPVGKALKPNMMLRRFLAERGFQLIARLTIDDVFVNKSCFKL